MQSYKIKKYFFSNSLLKHQANNLTEQNQLKNPDPLQAEKELEKYLTCTQKKTLPWSAEVLPLKKQAISLSQSRDA